MRIAHKITFVYVLFVVLLILVCIIGLLVSMQTGKEFKRMADESLPVIRVVEDMKYAVQKIVSSTTEFALLSNTSITKQDVQGFDFAELDRTLVSREKEFIVNGKMLFDHSLERYKYYVDTYFPEEKLLYISVHDKGRELLKISDDIILALRENGPRRVIFEKMAMLKTVETVFMDAVNQALDYEDKEFVKRKVNVLKALAYSAKTLIAVTILALLIILVIGFTLSRSITDGLKQLMGMAGGISRGEHDIEFNISSKDEIGDLANHFKQMVQELKKSNEKEATIAYEAAKVAVTAEEQKRKADELSIIIAERDEEIAERIRIEQAYEKARQEAEAASLAKSEFLANMSHEIRTPLYGVIGLTELCLATDLNEDQRRLLSTAYSEANFLHGLLSDILDFSKIEAGKFELEEISFSLQHLFDDLTKNYSMRAMQKGVSFIAYLAENIPGRLTGDPARLRQIFSNLLSNALKFTPEGGKVELNGIMTAETETSVGFKFSVSDTGVGISEDKIDKIFDSFTQADGSTTRKFGGTGLGTTIAKQLVELMGGEITATSSEKGTTFWFTVVLRKQLGHEVLTGDTIDLGKLQVLIVDKDSSVSQGLSNDLAKLGCTIQITENWLEAEQIMLDGAAEINPVNIVFINIEGRDEVGLSFVTRIKELRNIPQPSIIVLTSAGKRGDAKKCQDLGVDGYLTWPISRSQLQEVIYLACRRIKSAETLSKPLITKHLVAEAHKEDIRVLVAEDYPTNREVSKKHLSSAGYQVDVAGDGAQAVEAYKKNKYEVIFMDIQMPLQDGYQATAEIRRVEQVRRMAQNITDDVPTIPIVAMTAHSMKEDREKCIKAGMDDYISKPVRKRDLLAMAKKWTVGKPREPVATVSEALPENGQGKEEGTINNTQPMDYELAVEEFEGDREFLVKTVNGFIPIVTEQLEIIENAITAGGAEIVRREAHAIKGGAANLTAMKLSGVAYELEEIGSSGDLTKAQETLERMATEFNRLVEFFREKEGDIG